MRDRVRAVGIAAAVIGGGGAAQSKINRALGGVDIALRRTPAGDLPTAPMRANR